MLRYWIAGLLVLTALPAQAQETPVSAVCQILKTHNSSAAYQPGVDVNGKPVAPADLNAPVAANIGVVEIPVEVNLVQKFNMLAGNGVKLEPTVSTFKIYPDGRVMYGNQDITQNAQVVCNEGGKSSAIITPQIQQEEPKILGTLNVKQDGTVTAQAPALETKPATETVAAPAVEPAAPTPVAATSAAPQEVPLADQYCLMNGYVKELKPGFVEPIHPVPVQPEPTAAVAPKKLLPPVPNSGDIIKSVPVENDEIPGMTNNKTVTDMQKAPTTDNISVSTVPAQNTPVSIAPPPPAVPQPMKQEIKSPETIPTFANPVETRAQPSLPVRDVDKPLARPPGMPIESSWAPPPPKSDALSAPTMIVPPPAAQTVPFEKTEKAMTTTTKMTATQAAPATATAAPAATAPAPAPTAAHPSKALRIDTNPLRRNLLETP